MKTQRAPKLSPRMQAAIEELKALVRAHYPDATFRVARSPEEPGSIELIATVDAADTDAVLDVVIDRVLQFQLEDRLPIHVIPVRPRERVLAMLREAQAERGEAPPP
ncbi:MAG TPA: hypothetical protein VFB73_15965 [Chloroflexota bacterium]|nr:hypothetical protein [Chloroflexota bacterium]